LLLGAAFLSAFVHYLSKHYGLENWGMGAALGLPEYLNITWYVSLLTVGVAFIAGKGGFAFIIGGYVCYFFIAPLLSGFDLLPLENGVFITDPNTLRVTLYRPVGIGMLIGGALMGIILAFPLIKGAVKSMQNAAKVKSAVSADEMPIKLLYFAIGGSAVVLCVIAILSTEEMGLMRGIFMAVIGTLWIWIAGVILSECIGRTNWSPLSGMTLIAITILIIISSGLGDTASVIASVVVGAAACVAMSQATDLMLDLKTGYLVGATPKMQMTGQFLGAWLGPILIMLLIILLHQAYGLGSDQLPAPQGQALASMITGIQGGEVPLEKYIAGAAMGALLSAMSGGLGITVGLGFYLPFNIVLTYSLGTMLRLAVDAKMGKRFSEETGIPIAAGLIVGEALVGVGFAIYYVIQGAN
ncbi:MAG: oligopeptide transporter OPT family protein, partial [Enterobacterales bacterium]|nr:oligopeptide transporter OPT family protein [Enterobacterales bacterium]